MGRDTGFVHGFRDTAPGRVAVPADTDDLVALTAVRATVHRGRHLRGAELRLTPTWTNNATTPSATAVWVQRAANAGYATGLAPPPGGDGQYLTGR